MYAENGKIASRQTFRLYVFDLMGIATLLLPPYLAKLCGVDGVFAIVIGTTAGFLYLFYLGWIMKKMGKDMCSFLQEDAFPLVKNATYILIMLHSILTAGFCAYVFANLMQYSLIREMSYTTILLVILVVAAYAVSGGIESRARVYEVLFWFVLIPYVFMMIAALRNFELVYVDDWLQTDGISLAKGIYLVFLLLTPLFFSLFLIGEKEKNYGENMVKTVVASILVSAIILLGSYVILIGNFGAGALGNMRYPVVTLMSTIQFKGNFLKRMDALMLAVWFFTLYALLNLHLHYGVTMLKELFPGSKKRTQSDSPFKQSRSTGIKQALWWQVLLPTIGTFWVAWLLEQSSDWVWVFLDYYSYGAVPVMIAGPAFLLLIAKRPRKKNFESANIRMKKGVSNE